MNKMLQQRWETFNTVGAEKEAGAGGEPKKQLKDWRKMQEERSQEVSDIPDPKGIRLTNIPFSVAEEELG